MDTHHERYDFCFVCLDLVYESDLTMGMCRECWLEEQARLGLDTGIIPIEKKAEEDE